MVAGALAVLMLGMSGMPLTAGFIGKFQVFSAAWDAGFAWLVIVGLLASVAAFFFYLRLIVIMYFQQPDDDDVTMEAEATSPGVRWVVVFSSVVTIILGVFPGPLLDLMSNASPL